MDLKINYTYYTLLISSEQEPNFQQTHIQFNLYIFCNELLKSVRRRIVATINSNLIEHI